MNKKRSSFSFLFLILSFFSRCSEDQLPNPFGIPVAELHTTALPHEEETSENVLPADSTEEIPLAVNGGVDEPDEGIVTPVVSEAENTGASLPDLLYIKKESLFELAMLPGKEQIVTMVFEDSPISRHEKPRLIFDPTFFGNEGRVDLAPLSRLVFRGDGIIEVRNGVTFDLSSAQLVLEKGATLHIVPEATVTFVNHKPVEELSVESVQVADDTVEQKKAVTLVNQTDDVVDPGQLILRKGGKILLTNPSHLVFGAQPVDCIKLQVEFGGQFVVDNKDARVSFQQGTFDIFFNNFSMLRILNGIVELNMFNGLESAGHIRTWHFQMGALLEVKNNNHGIGTLSLAENNVSQSLKVTDFDNQTGFTRGNGNLRFKTFNEQGEPLVDSTVQLQNYLFEKEDSLFNLFMRLACIEVQEKNGHQVTLVRQGNSENGSPGKLAAFSPRGDGSIVPLLSGDHRLVYDSNEPGGPLSVIRGYDAHNRLFVIDGERRYS